jgi:oxygen-dependent protoporphyrinogen oxidase
VADAVLDVAVVGGGIAGLSAALALHKAGVPFALREASARWGGVIRTESASGFLLEGGPDSILAQKPEGLALVREVGLEGRLIPTNPERRQVFILRGGRLHALPEGMMLAVPTRVLPFLRSGLFSWPGKLRMGLDLVIPRRRGAADESIASLLRRRFGPESVERLGEPLMAGIHAGDPERLSIRATFPRFAELEARSGSLIRGMWSAAPARPAGGGPSAFYSLAGGLGELVEAVVARLPPGAMRRSARLAALERDRDGFRLAFADGESVRARAVVLCVPAPSLAPVLEGALPEAAALLRGIPFASSATVSLGFRREDVAHPLDGYGLVVPRTEGLRTTACSFFSTKFPGRAPDGHVLLRGFVGGVRDPDVLDLDDAALRDLVRRDMAPVLGLRGLPVLTRVARWPAGTPQMEVGHFDRIARLESILASQPRLLLAGAGLRGTGLPDVIADAQRAAAAAIAALA